MSSVKKALVAVSHRLQEGHHADRTKMIGQNPQEALVGVPRETLNSAPHDTFIGAPRETLIAAPRETLTDLHVDHLLQRGSSLSTSHNCSNSYATGVHSLSAEVNRVSSQESKAHQQEINFKIICSNDRVGGIIGKGGNIIKALQSETGATVSVGPSVAKCEDRLITITASEVCSINSFCFTPFIPLRICCMCIFIVTFLLTFSVGGGFIFYCRVPSQDIPQHKGPWCLFSPGLLRLVLRKG